MDSSHPQYTALRDFTAMLEQIQARQESLTQATNNALVIYHSTAGFRATLASVQSVAHQLNNVRSLLPPAQSFMSKPRPLWAPAETEMTVTFRTDQPLPILDQPAEPDARVRELEAEITKLKAKNAALQRKLHRAHSRMLSELYRTTAKMTGPQGTPSADTESPPDQDD